MSSFKTTTIVIRSSCGKGGGGGGRKEGAMICPTKKFSTFAISLSHCSGWHTHPRFPYKVVTIFSRKEE